MTASQLIHILQEAQERYGDPDVELVVDSYLSGHTGGAVAVPQLVIPDGEVLFAGDEVEVE